MFYKLFYMLSVFRAAMKMANLDHCFDHMFTNPKDPKGVSGSKWLLMCWTCVASDNTSPHVEMLRPHLCPLSFCSYLWQRTVRGSSCTLATCARGPEASQSTSCGGDAGTPKASAWRWKDPVTSNWKISTRRRASCLSPTMVNLRETCTSLPGRCLMNDSVKAWPLCVPGEGGVDGDGDITRPENVTAFRNFVLESTERRGLHFLMADGVRLFCTVIILLQGDGAESRCSWNELRFLFGDWIT